MLTLLSDLEESKKEIRESIIASFPPLHEIDCSVDSSLCEEVLQKMGVDSLQTRKELLNFIIVARREALTKN